MKPAPAAVVPLTLGPHNAEAATGHPWRWCKEFALARGVPVVRHGKKCTIEAAAFLAAMRALGSTPANEADDADAIARALGLE